jgi:succinyl-CoA synthetase alpha subunit
VFLGLVLDFAEAMHLTSDSQVLIQGIMEPLGQVHAPLMHAYGTNVVAGVSPGFGGQRVGEIPVFDLVEEAIAACGPMDTTAIFSPPYAVLDAALEAIAAGIRQMAIMTEGVPPLDLVELVRKAEVTDTLAIGPNCPGIIVPGQFLLGTHPAEFYCPGQVGIIGRSSTLTYEVALHLTQAGIGQSIAVSIGADPVVGSSLVQWLQMLDEDERTETIVLIGEVGGDSEVVAARYIAEAIDKPVVAYITGEYAPPGKLLGHASAIVTSRLAAPSTAVGTVASKVAALKAAKVRIAHSPAHIVELLQSKPRKSRSRR